MDQFGVHMHLLWIKQILWIVFILKTHFLIHFLDFITLWIGPQIPESAGAYLRKLPRLRCNPSWTAGSNLWFLRGYCAKCCGEGVRGDIGRRIRNPRPRSDPVLSEPVRKWGPRIRDLRSRFNYAKSNPNRGIGNPWLRRLTHATAPHPHDHNPTTPRIGKGSL
jgi:hypothetical protein